MAVVWAEDVDPVSQTVPVEALSRYVGHTVSVRSGARVAVGRLSIDELSILEVRGGTVTRPQVHRFPVVWGTKVVHNVASCQDDGCRQAHAEAIEAAQRATFEVLAAREQQLRAPAVGF